MLQGDRLYNISAIRKTLFGLPEFPERARVVLLVISASEMDFRQVRIERECVIEGVLGRRPPRPAWLESFPDTPHLCDREICPGQREIGIQLYCFLVQANCTLNITFRVKTPADRNRSRTQICIVSSRIVRGLGHNSRFLLRTERGTHRVGNVSRQFALQRKRVRQSAIIVLTPKMTVHLRINQLDRNAHTIS